MTTLRSRIFIMASIIVLLILAVSIFLIVMSKKKAAEPAEETTTTTPENVIDTTNFPVQITQPAATSVPSGTTIKQPTSEEVMKNAALQTAKIFIERYASYSTDNNFQNIKEVKTLVSDDLWAELSKKMNNGQEVTEFYGVTTKAFTSAISEWGVTKATVDITTTRTENMNGAISVSNQKVRIWVEKSGDNWVVDKFEWVK